MDIDEILRMIGLSYDPRFIDVFMRMNNEARNDTQSAWYGCWRATRKPIHTYEADGIYYEVFAEGQL